MENEKPENDHPTEKERYITLSIHLSVREALREQKKRFESYSDLLNRLINSAQFSDLREEKLDLLEGKVLNRQTVQHELDMVYKGELMRLEEKIRQGESDTRSLLAQNDRLKSEVVKLRKLDDRVYEPLDCVWQRYDVKGFKFVLPAGVAILAGSSLFGPCPVCQSKHVAEVDFHITAGSSSAAIAKKYKVPVEFIVEHRSICRSSGSSHE